MSAAYLTAVLFLVLHILIQCICIYLCLAFTIALPVNNQSTILILRQNLRYLVHCTFIVPVLLNWALRIHPIKLHISQPHQFFWLHYSQSSINTMLEFFDFLLLSILLLKYLSSLISFLATSMHAYITSSVYFITNTLSWPLH